MAAAGAQCWLDLTKLALQCGVLTAAEFALELLWPVVVKTPSLLLLSPLLTHTPTLQAVTFCTFQMRVPWSDDIVRDGRS